MPNNSALGILTARELQILALQKLNPTITINYTNTRNYYI